VSGRARSDLTVRADWSDDIRLVGSHGIEMSAAFVSRIPPDALSLRERLARELHAVASTDRGFIVEEKPASVAFHFRLAGREKAAQTVHELRQALGKYDGVFIRD